MRLRRPQSLEATMGTIAEEWKMEGKAEDLVHLLYRCFGALPRQAVDRIAAAELAKIEAWFDGAIDAPNLETVSASRRLH